MHEWKIGVESDNTILHEDLKYLITDPSRFDTDTSRTFAFRDSRPDLEQATYAQDLMRLHHWVIAAGLRWDHYQLLLNRQALEPRVSVSNYIPALDMVLHASYDQIFQTPSFENIKLA